MGKTSTCHHLAGTLAKAGQSVLLLDNDPQASLSQGFWGPDATRRIGAAESVAALYDADLAPIPEALSHVDQTASDPTPASSLMDYQNSTAFSSYRVSHQRHK